MTETIQSIVAAHCSGASTPQDTIARTFERIRQHDDPAIFISLRDEAEAIAEARALGARDGASLPLFGVPFAVKDNINVAGLPTTAACPAYSFTPTQDATSVARLRAAGAIVIGKTNLDQFATGLVGVRSPYGIPRNALDPALIPGGSSSGSAVAVAAGLVPMALGTDTAGSGRVPAMLNNIVGLKPSLGLVSNSGMIPACRTLDCVSVFALTVDDAMLALNAMAGHDTSDPYSRSYRPMTTGACPPHPTIGVPMPGQRIFFGDDYAARGYEMALERMIAMGARLVEVDLEPFFEVARLLYEGPWVAERYLAVKNLLASSPEALHPVTREIIIGGERPTAADAFAAFYRLQDLRQHCHRMLKPLDALMVPTAPTIYTVEQVLADPVTLNSRLGTYTNFVNLLDLCGLAVPVNFVDGHPFGVTLLAPAGQDAALASIGRVFHAEGACAMGASATPLPTLSPMLPQAQTGEVALVAVGAHLSGLALNHELRALNARLLESTQTAADYRLYALKGTVPPKPGLLRVETGTGAHIAVEVWALRTEAFGQFVSQVPPPLSIGTVRLGDGREAKGFLVEPAALDGARDISSFGGWRAFLSSARRKTEAN